MKLSDKEIVLKAAELIANSQEFFSCNAIQTAIGYHQLPTPELVRKYQEFMGLYPYGNLDHYGVNEAAGAKYLGATLAARNLRIIMLLSFAEQL